MIRDHMELWIQLNGTKGFAPLIPKATGCQKTGLIPAGLSMVFMKSGTARMKYSAGRNIDADGHSLFCTIRKLDMDLENIRRFLEQDGIRRNTA